MKKFIFLLALLVCASNVCLAQYSKIQVAEKNTKYLELENIAETENSTLLYFTITCNQESGNYYFIKHKTTIVKTQNAGNRKLLQVYNIPVYNEAETVGVRLDKVGQKHHFILEFEKIPLDSPFDFIEDPKSESAWTMRGISVDTTVATSPIDPVAFVNETPQKIYGQYADRGTMCQYFINEGVVLTANFEKNKEYGKYYRMNLNIINHTGHSIAFNMDKVNVHGEDTDILYYTDGDTTRVTLNKAEGKWLNEMLLLKETNEEKFQKKFKSTKKIYTQTYKRAIALLESGEPIKQEMTVTKSFPMQNLSIEEYDKKVRKRQNWSKVAVALSESMAASQAGTTTINTTSTTSANASYHRHTNYAGGSVSAAAATGTNGTAAGVGATAYNGYSNTSAYYSGSSVSNSHTVIQDGTMKYLAQQNADANIRSYENALDNDRRRLWDNYLQLNTIRDGACYGGFFNIKYKSTDILVVDVTIDDITYTFRVNV